LNLGPTGNIPNFWAINVLNDRGGEMIADGVYNNLNARGVRV